MRNEEWRNAGRINKKLLNIYINNRNIIIWRSSKYEEINNRKRWWKKSKEEEKEVKNR